MVMAHGLVVSGIPPPVRDLHVNALRIQIFDHRKLAFGSGQMEVNLELQLVTASGAARTLSEIRKKRSTGSSIPPQAR